MVEKTEATVKNEMITESSWEAFRESGMLWWINRLLHTFGWSILVEMDDENKKIVDAYPARVKFRGFEYKSEEKGFKRVSEFMAKEAERLLKEVEEE